MALFLIFVLIITLAFLQNPSVKGYIGEKAVTVLLNQLGKEYISLHDVMLPTNEVGKTVQIDHVVISKYGIFVIETKNFKGWIFGDETSKYWTQVIYKKKEKFYSPIKQNNAHISALKQFMGKEISPAVYTSIVCFTSKSTIKKMNTATPVIQTPKLIKTIKSFTRFRLSETEVSELYQKLTKHQQRVKKEFKPLKEKHIRVIKQNMNTKEQQINEQTCPKCQGDLIERKGKHGCFVGCSNYPKCRFTLRKSG
ncbi:NERD domain-containing protein [Pseudalkalibacillus caeni]|uniref:NERD domain-containing protein n=1 Tax=Exobacillus caeni TaxID=2574798 RepID=A0A5R9FD20_9BACL|nr:NERD domain-containing protein [Pseudalkalibacillus caeni]TLS38454.1 NERD domain-containing protein [Pseudalkalibacillus caeni]